MENRFRVIISLGFMLVIILVVIPLTIAQGWVDVKISAYGTAVYTPYAEHISGGATMEFTVVAPPEGLDVANSISACDPQTGEICTQNLQPGDYVYIGVPKLGVDSCTIEECSESQHYLINFEGQASMLLVNATIIPEFPIALMIPFFILATLLALIYRNKHKRNS